MKYKGKKIGASVDYCVIPRPEGDVSIKCIAIPDFDEFDAIIKYPTPPINIGKGGVRIPDMQDGTYKQQKARYENARLVWMILKSIEDNPDIEWEQVDITKPDTYGFYEKELKEAGFNGIEIGRIQKMVFQVNSLDEAHIQEARDLFLLTKAAELEATSGLPSGQ